MIWRIKDVYFAAKSWCWSIQTVFGDQNDQSLPYFVCGSITITPYAWALCFKLNASNHHYCIYIYWQNTMNSCTCTFCDPDAIIQCFTVPVFDVSYSPGTEIDNGILKNMWNKSKLRQAFHFSVDSDIKRKVKNNHRFCPLPWHVSHVLQYHCGYACWHQTAKLNRLPN